MRRRHSTSCVGTSLPLSLPEPGLSPAPRPLLLSLPLPLPPPLSSSASDHPAILPCSSLYSSPSRPAYPGSSASRHTDLLAPRRTQSSPSSFPVSTLYRLSSRDRGHSGKTRGQSSALS